MRKIITFLLLTTLFAGCAHLEVNVDCFDQRYWPYSAELVQAVRVAAADANRMEIEGVYNQWRADFKTSIYEAIEARPQLLELVKKKDKKLDDWISLVEKTVDDQVSQAHAAHQEGMRKWNEAIQSKSAYGKESEKNFEVLVSGAFSEFARGNAILRDIKQTLRKELATDPATTAVINAARGAPAATPVEKKDGEVLVDVGAQAATPAALSMIADGSRLHSDALASYILHAPKEAWKKGDINYARAFGGLGNTDIAVKMESQGEFTIKGVRVDADEVTAATFTVVKQAIQLLAAVNGIPITTETGKGKAVAPDQTLVGKVGSAERDRATADAKTRAMRHAAINLFDTIVRQRTVIAGNDQTARDGALKTIRSTYTGLKPQLAPADAPAPADGQ